MAVITARDTLFLNTTIYNYLWNATSPTIKLIKNILPFMVPMDNMGILHIVSRYLSLLIKPICFPP